MLAAVVALGSGIFSPRLRTWAEMPGGAIAFMRANRLHGNVLNNLDWGEYLIWHLTPQSRVFIDGRYDLVYPDNLIRDYLGFLFGWPGGEKLLDHYPHDLVLVVPYSGAYRFTTADKRWKMVYRDRAAALFVPSGNKIRPQVHAATDNTLDWSFP